MSVSPKLLAKRDGSGHGSGRFRRTRNANSKRLPTAQGRFRAVPLIPGYVIEMAHAHNSKRNRSNHLQRLLARGLSTLTIVTHVRLFKAMLSKWHKHIIQNINIKLTKACRAWDVNVDNHH